EAFVELGLGWWVKALRPVLGQFAAAARGDVDLGFWESMYKWRGPRGSGSPPPSGRGLHPFPPPLLPPARHARVPPPPRHPRGRGRAAAAAQPVGGGPAGTLRAGWGRLPRLARPGPLPLASPRPGVRDGVRGRPGRGTAGPPDAVPAAGGRLGRAGGRGPHGRG